MSNRNSKEIMKPNRNDLYKTQDPVNDDFDIGHWVYSTERPEDQIFQVNSMNADFLFDSGGKAYDPCYCQLIVATSDTRLRNIHIIEDDPIQETLEFAEWIELHGIRAGEHRWYLSADSTQKRRTTREIYEYWKAVKKEIGILKEK